MAKKYYEYFNIDPIIRKIIVIRSVQLNKIHEFEYSSVNIALLKA